MEKNERIENFKNWIEDGNDLAIEDMISVIIGHLSVEEIYNYEQKFMVNGRIFDVNIRCNSVN